MFNTRFIVPVGTPIKRFINMATPDTPPGAKSLGSRNRLIAHEYMTAPTLISRYFFNPLTSFLFVDNNFSTNYTFYKN
jgi:hypothetical protein